jgi:hypothetical protein
MLNSLKCPSAFREIVLSKEETFALGEWKLNKIYCAVKDKFKNNVLHYIQAI